MSTISVLKKPGLKAPKWDKTSAKPGDALELSVTAENADGMKVAFEIRNDNGETIGVLEEAGDTRKAAWTAPMLAKAGDVTFTFYAFLRGKPVPSNGHLGVIERLKSENNLVVKGTKITGLKADKCFVPKHEKLAVVFTVEGEAPAKGSIEIWGERYPTGKAIYTEAFAPSLGENKWEGWHGGKHPKTSEVAGKITAAGPLSDKYLSPEFSPYKLRVIVGPDTASVEAPLVAGLGKVSIAETQFEVKIESIQIRIMQGLTEAIAATHADRRFRLENVLAIEPRAANGSFAAMGRLPCLTIWQATFLVAADGDRDFDVSTVDASLKFKKGANEITVWKNDTKLTLTTDYTEEGDADDLVSKIKLKENFSKANDTLLVVRVDPTSKTDQNARLRIPMAKHQVAADNLDMAGRDIGDGYLDGGSDTKHTIDSGVFSRPELPIELLPLLTSKTSTKNEKPYHGVFEAEAIGPLKVEPVAEDNFIKALYTAGDAQHKTYFRYAHHKIKKGTHDVPENAANKPVFYYWQWSLKLSADNGADTELDLDDPDRTNTYKVGSDELTVWLNRAKLVKNTDFKEVGGNATASKKISLLKGVGKKDDILWVVRSDSTASGGDKVDAWKVYPAGTNCHVHYGGLRGNDAATAANRLFLKNFSAGRGGAFDPIIGKDASGNTSYKDKNFVQLAPDPVTNASDQERVEITAVLTGNKKGLPGVIFSPSFIGADSYILRFRLDNIPYERNYGDISDKPFKEAKTGAITNWRWCQIGKSLRCPDLGGEFTLRATVGSDPEPALNTRSYKGIGRNINLDTMNDTLLSNAFNEWTVPLPSPITAATNNTDPIKITTSVPHGLSTGEKVKIWGIKGNTNANGASLTVTKVDDTNFTINDVTGNADYVSGGLVEPLEVHKDLDLEEYVTEHDNAVGGLGAGAVLIGNPHTVPVARATNATPIVISTKTPHRLISGDRVLVAGVTGNLAANGVHVITQLSAKTFSLNGSVGSGVSSGTPGSATLVDFPGQAAVTGATNDANPIIITAVGHGLATGDQVLISDVTGNTAANGNHTIERVTDDTFKLPGVVGIANYVSGGTVTIVNILITGASNANPIEITTAGSHGLHNRERVTISGVVGNTAANGNHTITKVNDNVFKLDGVKGNADYTKGGIVRTRDFHHRNITNWLVQYDVYRDKLPPNIPSNRKKIASRAIFRDTAAGDCWADVNAEIQTQIISWNASHAGDLGGSYTGTVVPASPSGWSEEDYFDDVNSTYWDPVAFAIVDHFTPKNTNPKSVSVIRWPRLHDPSWSITWEGQSLGDGQALIVSRDESTTLYSHEMGHAMHLIHFLGGNFGWKHHDLNFPQCMMSYNYIEQSINKPGGGVGVDGDSLEAGGWPSQDPTTLDYRIYYDTLDNLTIALDKPCARCMLKLQGWNEEVLPAAWTHPDLF